jgi:REP element-mobilizing transposase RayT
MIPLIPGNSYHIFNHANGFENVFRSEENFRYFLEKYWLYISPVAETYAYCLMPNHFHVVVRIRKRQVIETIIRTKNFGKVIKETIPINTIDINFSKVEVISDGVIEKYISKQFANLFSCYTQSFNKMYHRMGSLFIKNFKREQILDKQHFFNVVIYTHRNPIHHGFRKDYYEWDYSSYNEIVEGNNDHMEIIKLMKMIGGIELFMANHNYALKNFEASGLDIPS